MLKTLFERLYRRRVGPLPVTAVVLWWEVRRVPYNAFTCESHGGAPIGLPDPPLFALVGVVLYGILANVCYTGGWITELVVSKVWSIDTSSFGPIAFTLGTTFAAFVTLIPAALVVATALLTRCGR